MTTNTKASIITLVSVIALYIAGPLTFVLLAAYIAVYALIATIAGEEVLQENIGTTTTLGYILIGIFIFIALFPILLSIYSLIAERITKGKKTPLLSFAKWLRRHCFKITIATLLTGILFTLVGLLSYLFVAPPYYDDVNIGAGMMFIFGIACLIASIPFLIFRRPKR